MEMNKNTLELKTARDGPALTYLPHVLEAVMLKAANEIIKILSRSRTTDILQVRTRAERKGGTDYLPNTTSLSTKKGRLINRGIFAFASIVGCVTTGED